ncbi:MAG: hypothetical protein JKY41_01625 [Rhodobacteraceae bacterium]|nr:hypothetical protein [Paracoccaceae bacterium]
MAKLGDVLKFDSNKVAGSQSKPKYHIAIDLNAGYLLFINSDPYEGAFAIDRSDWPEMPKKESFISFSTLIRYSREDLKDSMPAEPCGTLSDACIEKIREHALESMVLEQWAINLIVASIDNSKK